MITIASILFIGFVLKTVGIQPSISDSFQALKDKYGNGSLTPWLLWLYLIIVGILFMYQIPNWLSFIALVGAGLAGVTANYKQFEARETLHIIGATTLIIFAFISIGVFFGGWSWLWLPGYLGSIYLLKRIKITNYTWWIECLAIVFIEIALFIENKIVT